MSGSMFSNGLQGHVFVVRHNIITKNMVNFVCGLVKKKIQKSNIKKYENMIRYMYFWNLI